MSLTLAIQHNQRRWKYRQLHRRLLLRVFDYEDTGRTDQYLRVLYRCRVLAGYAVDHHHDEEEGRRMGNLLRSHPRYGLRALTLRECLEHRAIPTAIKRSYVEFMEQRYPTSNFGFREGIPCLSGMDCLPGQLDLFATDGDAE